MSLLHCNFDCCYVQTGPANDVSIGKRRGLLGEDYAVLSDVSACYISHTDRSLTWQQQQQQQQQQQLQG